MVMVMLAGVMRVNALGDDSDESEEASRCPFQETDCYTSVESEPRCCCPARRCACRGPFCACASDQL